MVSKVRHFIDNKEVPLKEYYDRLKEAVSFNYWEEGGMGKPIYSMTDILEYEIEVAFASDCIEVGAELFECKYEHTDII